MVARSTLLSFALLAALALVAGSLDPTPGHAQNKKGTKGGSVNKPAVPDQTKFQEADLLRQAYVLLAMANHDYNGYRGKAMHQVHLAFNALDKHISSKGSAPLKAAVAKERSAINAALQASRNTKSMHERQEASDAQMAQAARLLTQLQPTLTTNGNTTMAGHVNTALSHIGTALQIR